MQDKRILTIQDISCVGQCSLTVALPIISACGVETSILPSAVLSTHTSGFTGYTFRDLSEDMPAINAHWRKEGIKFDAVYTGYLGSARQVADVQAIMRDTLVPGGLRIVDPAMGDNGQLYPGFDAAYAQAMAALCGGADIILPNITEACFMTGVPYPDAGYDEAFIHTLLEQLAGLGAGSVVLTGVSYAPDQLGVIVYEGGRARAYFHERIPKGSHGTGDVYASAFTGALMRGFSIFEAAQLAADFTVACIRRTLGDERHWYGVKFEQVLPMLVERINRG